MNFSAYTSKAHARGLPSHGRTLPNNSHPLPTNQSGVALDWCRERGYPAIHNLLLPISEASKAEALFAVTESVFYYKQHWLFSPTAPAWAVRTA